MNQEESLLHTPLFNLHRELGAKMVPFAGYAMPVQYPGGIISEHLHTRHAAGLFDVSHMGQLTVSGERAASALESLMPMDIEDLGLYRQRYALLTNDTGGIRDDLMVTRREDDFALVVNAACKAADVAYISDAIGEQCRIEIQDDHALLALQGPQAMEVLARFDSRVTQLRFMDAGYFTFNDVSCFVSRSGYTGEDGVEISLPADAAESFARTLLDMDEVLPVGLGARDSLRLEAGLCLYGHDIDTITTPVEAGLTWAIQKVRRRGGKRVGGFPGAARILEQLDSGVERKRVGIRPLGRAPVREGAELVTGDGAAAGVVTSGGFGPSINAPVAMGYVAAEHAAVGTPLKALVRNREIDVEVHHPAFVAHGYAR
jgi:aminomethyltransferase